MTFLTRVLGATLLAAASLASHAQAPQPPEIAAKSYLLVDVTAGQTLAAKDADSPVEPASLTKLMSAYLVFDALKAKKITLTQTLPVSPETAFGIVMIQSFVVSFGFILPTNAPQNMLCYGTNAFNTAQFAKVGVVVTLAGLGLILLLSATLWPAMGVL